MPKKTEDMREYQRQYREANKARIRELQRNWYYANKELCIEKSKDYYQRNKEKTLEYHKEYREKNIAKLAEKERIYKRNRYKNDLNYKSAQIVRHQLRRVLVATGRRKRGKTIELVGYSPDKFKAHIERQFRHGMSWDNYGKKWHIDHIIPVSKFIKDGITDPAVINALTSLKPIPAEENLTKRDKVLTLL